MIKSVVNDIDIGINDNLIGYISFGQHAHLEMDLKDHIQRADLISSLGHEILHVHHSSHGMSSSIESAIEYITQRDDIGDRQAFPDAIVLVTAVSSFHHYDHSQDGHLQKLHGISNNVITIVVGSSSDTVMAEAGVIATNPQQVLTVDDLDNYRSILYNLLHLLNQC